MTTLPLPHSFDELNKDDGTPLEVKLQQNFDRIKTQIGTADIVTSGAATSGQVLTATGTGGTTWTTPASVPDLSAVPHTEMQVAARLGTQIAGFVSELLPTHNNEAAGTNDRSPTVGTAYQGTFWLPAAVAVTGKTAKVRLAADVIASAAFAGAITYSTRLHAATVAAGVVTLGTQIATVTVINAATPADGAPQHNEGAWVTHPGAGLYVITVTGDAATPTHKAGARLQLNYQ